MKKFQVCLSFILFLMIFFSCTTKNQLDVCGTWRMVEGVYIGPDFKVTTNAENRICYKILSGDHFAVVEMYAYNPDSMFFAAVGSYTIEDSTYTEIYEASNVPTKIGEKMVFHSVIENKTWKISLKKDDLHLEETWVCVKAMPGKLEL